MSYASELLHWEAAELATETSYAAQNARYKSSRYPGTLSWLFELPEYDMWLRSQPQTLLFRGVPGAGKSVAASAVVEDLEHRFCRDQTLGEERSVGIAYVFFDSLRGDEQNHDNLLRCIAHQLIQDKLVGERPNTSRDGDFQPRRQPRPKTVSELLALHSAFFIVLDSLDECAEPCRTALLRTLAGLQAKHATLNILVTLRTCCTFDVSKQFKGVTAVEIWPRHADLVTYVAGNVDVSEYGAERRDYAISKVVQASRGRFLRATLYLKLLALTTSFQAFDAAVSTAPLADPDDYSDIYGNMMYHIGIRSPRGAKLTEGTLPWLAFAKRPLSVADLRQALELAVDGRAGPRIEVRDDDEFVSAILSSCGGLARLDRINDIPCIHLSHRTARDYLRRRLQHAGGEVGRLCIAYLYSTFTNEPCGEGDEEELAGRLRSRPLYRYAAQNWGRHFRTIAASPAQFDTTTRAFFTDLKGWRIAVQTAGADDLFSGLHSAKFVKTMTALHLAAYGGAANVVEYLLAKHNNDASINAIDGYGRTPLAYAAVAGNLDMAKTLLAGGHVDVDVRDNTGRTPILLAAQNGHAEVVSMLLEGGANPNLQDLQPATPLWYAVERNCGTVVRVLAGSGRVSDWNPTSHHNVRVSATGSMNETASALELAVKGGYDDIALILLDKIGSSQRHGSDLLVFAAGAGSTSVVETLLTKHGTDPNAAHTYEGRIIKTVHTPLMAAVSRGMGAVVRLLLAADGIQPEATVDGGLTALSLAAKDGLGDMVKLLLKDDRVIVDHKDNAGRTALSLAAENAHEDVVAKLLASGRADVNTRDESGLTPLTYAVQKGCLSLVNMFLEHPEAISDYETPFLTAIGKNDQDLARALLKTERLNINATAAIDIHDGTALGLAAKSGDENMVSLLLSIPGIDPDKKNAYGRSPLAEAAWSNHTEIVKKLLAKGADPNSRIGGMALLRDASHDRELFRGRRFDVDPLVYQGRTPLSLAVQGDFVEVVDILLSADGIDPDAQDAEGRSPLSWAIGGYSEKKAMRRLLRIQAVDVNAVDAQGKTPLIRAIQDGGDGTAIKLLLERDDLEVNRRSLDGRTPISIARERKDAAAVSILLENGAVDDAPEALCEARSDSDIGGTKPVVLKVKENTDAQLQSNRNWIDHAAFKWSDSALMRFSKAGTLPSSEYRVQLNAQKEYDDSTGSGGKVELCPRCEAIDLDRAFSEPYTKIFDEPALADLDDTDDALEKSNCPLCQLICAVHPRLVNESEDRNHKYKLVSLSSTSTWLCHDRRSHYYFRDSWIDTLMLGVVADRASTSSPFFIKDLKSGLIGRLGSSCPDRSKAITVRRLAADRMDFEAARGWIRFCKEGHSHQCNPETQTSIPHFYLIDCATREIAKQGGSAPPYVALSYVWGKAAPVTAEMKDERIASNLDRRSLDTEGDVPAVVEDAIRVTMELGYRHLWADQYCVVQKGNEAVKRQQLQMMHRVYAAAEVTLVAAAGEDSSFGLPGAPGRPRRPQPYARVKGHALVAVPADPSYKIKASAWATRGWTYQEGLLARRRLFFTEQEVSFECEGLLCREALRLPLRMEQNMHCSPRLMKDLWTYDSGLSISGDVKYNLFELLPTYMSRRLTFQSDALNAMLGIFQVISEQKREPAYHLCGLPVSRSREATAEDHGLTSFISGLCWRLQRPALRRDGFPSWSWTGWQGVLGGAAPSIDPDDGFDIDVSVVLESDGAVVAWGDCYEQLANGIDTAIQHGQNHLLEITAAVATVRFRKDLDKSNGPVKNDGWAGFVCAGDNVWKGDFQPTRRVGSPPKPAAPDETVAAVAAASADLDLEQRLLENQWLGIILANSSPRERYNNTYLLIVEERQAPVPGKPALWERIGLLHLHCSQLRKGMFERRTMRLT